MRGLRTSLSGEPGQAGHAVVVGVIGLKEAFLRASDSRLQALGIAFQIVTNRSCGLAMIGLK
ncbi:hypothetical protein SAMN03159453_02144 [Pseudomonas sp. NFIX28]|nr:hypothetical protein SAMN03159453_02144 [Pseudomonas sp. NFIX28]